MEDVAAGVLLITDERRDELRAFAPVGDAKLVGGRVDHEVTDRRPVAGVDRIHVGASRLVRRRAADLA